MKRVRARGTTGDVTTVFKISLKIPEWKTSLGHGHGYEGIAKRGCGGWSRGALTKAPNYVQHTVISVL